MPGDRIVTRPNTLMRIDVYISGGRDMPRSGISFERALVSALNRSFIELDLPALAYRRLAPPGMIQECDVVVDSYIGELFMGIECKSVRSERSPVLYWSSAFSTVDGVHQIDRESEWLRRTGRAGYLAVEIRGGKGVPREAHMVPWRIVAGLKRKVATGISLETVRKYPALDRDGTQYNTDRWVAEIARDELGG